MRCQRCDSELIQRGDMIKGTPDVCLGCGYVQKGIIERLRGFLR